MTLFEKALVLHLVGDWLLQNDWMARNKDKLKHPAAWVHGGIHTVLLGLVFGWCGGLSRTIGQTQTGEMGLHVLIWGDQVIHISTIALWMVVSPLLVT
jgi:hypothetical protein